MKSISLIFLAIFAVLATVTAKSVYEPRIVNGENAKEGQFPYVASLRNAANRHFCGASIVSTRFLLTAAHCCTGSNASPENVHAVVGVLRQTEGGVVVKVDKITSHKGFVLDGIYNDIGLIRTAKEITFTDYIQPIALPKENLSEDTSLRVVLSGWGRHMVRLIYNNFSNFDFNSNSVCNFAFGFHFNSSPRMRHPIFCNTMKLKRSITKSVRIVSLQIYHFVNGFVKIMFVPSTTEMVVHVTEIQVNSLSKYSHLECFVIYSNFFS